MREEAGENHMTTEVRALENVQGNEEKAALSARSSARGHIFQHRLMLADSQLRKGHTCVPMFGSCTCWLKVLAHIEEDP